MVADAQTAELDRLFQALANGTRRDILRRTLRGSVSVGGLATDYDMSFAAVQKHVAVLERAALVRKTAVGRERLVLAVPAQIGRARACLERFEEIWSHRLTTLDEILTHTEE
jgi:DNA-binding transcriptional ArsR family regulator